MTLESLPTIIQGGMGVGVSGWRLARAVGLAGQLGVVSGTALDTIRVRRLRALRQRRDPEKWQASLRVLEDQARVGENLMPAIVEAVSASATVGEITNTLREVFGEHRENLVL